MLFCCYFSFFNSRPVQFVQKAQLIWQERDRPKREPMAHDRQPPENSLTLRPLLLTRDQST